MNFQSQQISPSINVSCLFSVLENDNCRSPLQYKALPHPQRERTFCFVATVMNINNEKE